MIITEPTPQSSLKAKQAALNGGIGNNSALLPNPPAYMHYGAHPSPAPPQRHQSPAKRFFKAFFVAIVIYSLVGMLTSSMVWISVDGHSRIGPNGDAQGWPTPADGQLFRCIGGSDWISSSPSPPYRYPYAAQAYFEYPISSDVLYFLARGSLSHGSVEVVAWEDGGDTVKIEVEAQYFSQAALDRANVCSISRREGENGIGIFTPPGWGHRTKEDYIKFGVLVHIPVQHAHVLINAFETDMPMFSHSFRLSKTVNFGQLSVRGSNMPISATGLYADRATLRTSNGNISGYYNASTSLELHTSNAPISAYVGLHNNPAGPPTALVMETSNGYIESILSLLSPQNTGGSYNVHSKTSNGRLRVHYDTSPLDSTLIHNARTSNSPATVNLHPAYEGTFALQSSNLSPSVNSMHSEDPSGQRRKRWFQVFKIDRNQISGAAYWGEKKPEVQGNIVIQTSNAPAKLVLL